MKKQTLADIGEFATIDRLVGDLQMPPAVSVGPGDDGAVYRLNGDAVTTVDMLVEDVHFRVDWCLGSDVGRKTIGANVADLEAMGAVPVALVVAAGLPKSLEIDWIEDFYSGLKDEAAKAGITIVGGDLTGSEKIAISATAIGELGANKPILRSGAKPGDQVAIRGRLGWAAAGLATLSRGFRSPRAVVEAYRYPQVVYGAGQEAQAAGAHAMLDISDGLVADLEHIAQASGVNINIETSSFRIPEPLLTVGQALNHDPMDFILSGGEDHALAATFAPGTVPESWQIIGEVSQSDSPEVLVDGKSYSGRHGWSHFTN